MIGEILTDENIEQLTNTKRKITDIIIHCSATKEGKDYSVFDIDKWHKARKFKSIGYHFVIYRNGQIVCGRPISEIGAHTTNHNTGSIGICYIGGLDENGNPKDTKTYQQENALINLVKYLAKKFNVKRITGHYNWAAKACPCFDVEQWLDDIDMSQYKIKN